MLFKINQETGPAAGLFRQPSSAPAMLPMIQPIAGLESINRSLSCDFAPATRHFSKRRTGDAGIKRAGKESLFR
jgi:hypothetical protein